MSRYTIYIAISEIMQNYFNNRQNPQPLKFVYLLTISHFVHFISLRRYCIIYIIQMFFYSVYSLYVLLIG